MNPKRLAELFNIWLQRFTEHPDEFSHQWQTVTNFLAEKAAGKEPSYGDVCIAYLAELDAELLTSEKAPTPPVSVG